MLYKDGASSTNTAPPVSGRARRSKAVPRSIRPHRPGGPTRPAQDRFKAAVAGEGTRRSRAGEARFSRSLRGAGLERALTREFGAWGKAVYSERLPLFGRRPRLGAYSERLPLFGRRPRLGMYSGRLPLFGRRPRLGMYSGRLPLLEGRPGCDPSGNSGGRRGGRAARRNPYEHRRPAESYRRWRFSQERVKWFHSSAISWKAMWLEAGPVNTCMAAPGMRRWTSRP